MTVRLTPRPAPPTRTQAPLPAPAVDVRLTSSAPTGNQWLRNGQSISGAAGATYLVTTPGVSGPYTVQVTARGCVGPATTPLTVTLVTGLTADAGAALLLLTPNPADDGLQDGLDFGRSFAVADAQPRHRRRW